MLRPGGFRCATQDRLNTHDTGRNMKGAWGIEAHVRKLSMKREMIRQEARSPCPDFRLGANRILCDETVLHSRETEVILIFRGA